MKVSEKAEGASLYEEALARMHEPSPDIIAVFDLLKRASDLGDANATYAIATWYLFGKEPVVRKNFKRGNELLRVAADGGNTSAMHDLAISYERGKGIKKNLKLAYAYYVRAALRGHQQCINEVGRCLYVGIGVPKDRTSADLWYERAKELGVFE